MNPIDPGLGESMGHDAFMVWMDFWELTGRMRIDILRRTETGGDPSTMTPPEVTETTIPGVPAILVSRDFNPVHDRSGELDAGSLVLETVDRVRDSDILVISGARYEVMSVTEKDMGDFAIWVTTSKPVS